jgi:hypothetical protein
MNPIQKLVAVMLVLTFMLICELAEAGGIFRAAVRATTRGAEKQAERTTRIEQAYARDAIRDAATPAKSAPTVRRVQRYTSTAQAEREAREGISAGSHMTPNVARGRGISSDTAQARYGLAEKPEQVMTIEIPAGTPLRSNKALGGAAGRGEVIATTPIPATAIKSTRPVAKAKAEGSRE